MTKPNYYFIGDLHGQFDKLTELLEYLDFVPEDRESAASCGQLVFLGDLIDNSAQPGVCQLATLKLVRSLCEQGLAHCLLGNHEFNAIGWWMRHPQTDMPLRRHSEDNRRQHQLFLAEVGEGSELHAEWVSWFMSRPLFIDLDTVRAIHACWDDAAISRLEPYLNADHSLKPEFWPSAFDPDHELYSLCETLLKGPEIQLPAGYSFTDKNGKQRQQIRVRWWQEEAQTYRELAQVQDAVRAAIPDLPLPLTMRPVAQQVPVVVGHYTLSGIPELLSQKVICVDYNAAAADQPLICYQWLQTQHLGHIPDDANFVSPQLPCFASEAKAGLYEHLALRVSNYEWPSVEQSHLETFCREVSHILWHWWDPAGVSGIDECRDEYDGYVGTIARLTLGAPWQEVAGYLLGLELVCFGCETDAERCGRVASRLVAARDTWLGSVNGQGANG